MAKDADLLKLEAEHKQKEIKRLLDEIARKINKVPQSVIDGSYNTAIDYKEAAKKGLSLINSKRPTLEAARRCAGILSRFN